MSQPDISAHILEIYGFEVSDSTISRVTDKILPVVKEWQQRPLESIYAVVFLDAIHYHVRCEGRIVKKAVYVAIGINLDNFATKWDSKHLKISISWRKHWAELSTYFKYPQSVRTLIYTTNSIENFNRQLRKVTKSKAVFPNDDSLMKILYLATIDVTKKWTGRRKYWGEIRSQLDIYFDERLPE